MLLHGLASSWVTFQNVIPLVEPTHRTVAIDLLGFGGSPISERSDYSIADHAAAVVRTIRSLRLREGYTLVGHSLGALVAARIAAQHPKSIRKLVLVSPPIYLAPDELGNQLDRTVMDFYLRAYRYLRENKEFTLRNAAAVERFLPIPNAMDINERTWIPFVRSLENSIESQTTLSDLAATRAPAEVIYGSRDEFHSDGVMKIVQRMSGVTVHRIAGSDHLIGARLARVVATAIG